jgi:hypothetical protein
MEPRIPFPVQVAAVVVCAVIIGGIIGVWPVIAPAGAADWLASQPALSSIYSRVANWGR